MTDYSKTILMLTAMVAFALTFGIAFYQCDADCHARGGVLVRGPFSYECVEPRR